MGVQTVINLSMLSIGSQRVKTRKLLWPTVFRRLQNFKPSHGILIFLQNFAEVENSLAIRRIFDFMMHLSQEKKQTELPKAERATNIYRNMAQS